MAGKKNKASKPRKTAPKSQSRNVAKPALLAGGNPQIAKGDGDSPRLGQAGQRIARSALQQIGTDTFAPGAL